MWPSWDRLIYFTAPYPLTKSVQAYMTIVWATFSAPHVIVCQYGHLQVIMASPVNLCSNHICLSQQTAHLRQPMIKIQSVSYPCSLRQSGTIKTLSGNKWTNFKSLKDYIFIFQALNQEGILIKIQRNNNNASRGNNLMSNGEYLLHIFSTTHCLMWKLIWKRKSLAPGKYGVIICAALHWWGRMEPSWPLQL